MDSLGNVLSCNVFAPDGLVARDQAGTWTQYAFDEEGNVARSGRVLHHGDFRLSRCRQDGARAAHRAVRAPRDQDEGDLGPQVHPALKRAESAGSLSRRPRRLPRWELRRRVELPAGRDPRRARGAVVRQSKVRRGPLGAGGGQVALRGGRVLRARRLRAGGGRPPRGHRAPRHRDPRYTRRVGSVAQRLSATGTVLSSSVYDGYGGGGVTPDPFGYHAQDGYYTDVETGLVYCQNRYYDPGAGRWVTRDPIGANGGINEYGYCASGPLGRIDSSGLLFTSLDSPGSAGALAGDENAVGIGARQGSAVRSLGNWLSAPIRWLARVLGIGAAATAADPELPEQVEDEVCAAGEKANEWLESGGRIDTGGSRQTASQMNDMAGGPLGGRGGDGSIVAQGPHTVLRMAADPEGVPYRIGYMYDKYFRLVGRVDVTDHGTPEFHPWGPHFHPWSGGAFEPGTQLPWER